MSEFKKGFTWAICQFVDKLEECRKKIAKEGNDYYAVEFMTDILTIQSAYEDVLLEDGHLVIDLIKKGEEGY